jgi:hypothetical protein
MLALFRTNQVATVLPLALMAVLWHLPGIMGWVQMPTSSATNGWLYDWLSQWIAATPMVSAISASVLVFLQALIINWLCNESRVTNDRNWIPAVIYILVVSFLRDYQFMSAPLMATTFVLLAMRANFHSHKSGDVTLAIFDTGFLAAMAAIIYPLAIWLGVGFYVGLMAIRVFRPREQVVYLMGLLIPAFLGWTYAVLIGQGSAFRQHHFAEVFDFGTLKFGTQSPYYWVASGLLAFLFVIVLANYNTYALKKLMHVRKFINAMFWLIATTCVSYFILEKSELAHFALTAPAIGICLGATFQGIKRHWLAELLHLLLAGGAVAAMLLL